MIDNTLIMIKRFVNESMVNVIDCLTANYTILKWRRKTIVEGKYIRIHPVRLENNSTEKFCKW